MPWFSVKTWLKSKEDQGKTKSKNGALRQMCCNITSWYYDKENEEMVEEKK